MKFILYKITLTDRVILYIITLSDRALTGRALSDRVKGGAFI